MIRKSRVLWALPCVAMLSSAEVSCGDTVTLNAVKDNTLIEVPESNRSNGQGSIFSGRTGTNPPPSTPRSLRGVMMFDVAAGIPAGSTINSATLVLNLEQGNGDFVDGELHTLHRLLVDWGEGASFGPGGTGGSAQEGDATWLHRFYSTTGSHVFWTTPGGDFVAAASASTVVLPFPVGDYFWASAGVIGDVQMWLDSPCTNFGWLLRGDESTTNTAKKFYSDEDFTPEVRPRLIVDFTPPKSVCVGDTNDSGAVDVDDLIAVILGWGPCPACPAGCPADVTGGNNAVDVDDLIAVILNWGPCD